MLIKGVVTIGSDSDGNEITTEFDGNPDFRMDIKSTVKVGDHVILEPGSWVDGLGVLHGPLRYHNIHFPADGGIHYNGCAYSHDGSDKPENPYYREECIEYLLLQEGFENLKL